MRNGREDDEEEKIVCSNCGKNNLEKKIIEIEVIEPRCHVKCGIWSCSNCKEYFIDSLQMKECLKK